MDPDDDLCLPNNCINSIVLIIHFILSAVEEVLDPETDLLVPERTYGCLPADEQVNIIFIFIIIIIIIAIIIVIIIVISS